MGLLKISNIRRPSAGWEGLAISGHPVQSTSLRYKPAYTYWQTTWSEGLV
jgi:hypothetical protein